MKPTRHLCLLLAVCGVAACSEQQSAAPNTAPVTTVAPTTTLASTTTVAPATTLPSTTIAETTTLPSTTTTPPVVAPSGVPTGSVVPVFAGSDLEPWLYLGRWSGDAWEGAFDADNAPIDPALATNATVTITDLDRGRREGSGGVLGESCSDGRIGPSITPIPGAPTTPGFGYSSIALSADWPLVPRQVAEVDADIPAYAEAGVAAFAGDDVETQAGEVDQIVVADLDGDGDTEALVVFGDESESEGDVVDPGFSGLLLIDTDSGAATTIAKSFVPLTIEEGEPAAFDSYRILDVADLNGDGLMEIVVHEWIDDSAAVTVYTYDGETVTEVISTGCGF